MTTVTPRLRVPCAPDVQIVREVKVNDPSIPTFLEAGINCADFDEVRVTATLLNSATAATIEPHFWSDNKDGTPNGGFVEESSPNVLSVPAAGKTDVFRVGHAKSVFFGVTGITGGVATNPRVRIEVSGIPVYGNKGG